MFPSYLWRGNYQRVRGSRTISPSTANTGQSDFQLWPVQNRQGRFRAALRKFVAATRAYESHHSGFISFFYMICNGLQDDCRRILAGSDRHLPRRAAQCVIAALQRGAAHRIVDGHRLRNGNGTGDRKDRAVSFNHTAW